MCDVNRTSSLCSTYHDCSPNKMRHRISSCVNRWLLWPNTCAAVVRRINEFSLAPSESRPLHSLSRYSTSNSTKSPALGAGNVSEPTLTSENRRVEVMCTYTDMLLQSDLWRCQYSCAYVIAAITIWGSRTVRFVTQNDGDSADVVLLYQASMTKDIRVRESTKCEFQTCLQQRQNILVRLTTRQVPSVRDLT